MKHRNPDAVLDSLLARYFEVIASENYPKTPKLTTEADNLEEAIRELQTRNDD